MRNKRIYVDHLHGVLCHGDADGDSDHPSQGESNAQHAGTVSAAMVSVAITSRYSRHSTSSFIAHGNLTSLPLLLQRMPCPNMVQDSISKHEHKRLVVQGQGAIKHIPKNCPESARHLCCSSSGSTYLGQGKEACLVIEFARSLRRWSRNDYNRASSLPPTIINSCRGLLNSCIFHARRPPSNTHEFHPKKLVAQSDLKASAAH